MAEKKKSTPKTPFEKIGAAYEREAIRQEKNDNPEMAARTRQAAAKSMTGTNQRAFEEDTQRAKESKVASKKKTPESKLRGKGVAKPDAKDSKPESKLRGKGVAVEAAGTKAKDAVSAAVERNPVSGPPSPAGDKENTGSGKSTERTPKPSSKLRGTMAPKEEDGTPFDGDAYAGSDEGKASRAAGMEKGKNKSPLRAAEDADARSKAAKDNPAKYGTTANPPKSPLRAGPEGTSGKSKGTRVGASDITTEMPATTKDKDAERASRIRGLVGSGVSTDPGDGGKMPDDPKPRTKPTVLITPTDKGEMPTPKADKPGFMDRLRGRVKSFTTPAAGGAPPAPPTPPSGSGGGVGPTGPMGPKGPAGPAPEPEVSSTLDTKDGKQSQSAPAGASYSFGDQAGGAQRNVGSRAQQGENSQMSGGDSAGNDVNKGNKHTQNINAGYGPVTATTSGKATGSGKGGVTASTTGTASSHPRAANATRGGRPTSRKK